MTIDIPVVIIFYNRPEKLKRLFIELKKFKPKKLFLISDGAKNTNDKEKILKCRKLIKPNWKCKIYKNFSKKNLGCRKRVLSGLNWVFSKVDKAIILEDDIIPSNDFFKFMKFNLKKYKNNKKIASICSANHFYEWKHSKNSFLKTIYFNPSGWGTWKDRWLDTNQDINSLLKKAGYLKLFKILKSLRACIFWRMLLNLILKGKRDSWALTWIFSNFLKKRKHIIPIHTLIENIGFDETATHRIDKPRYYIEYNKLKKNNIFPIKYKKKYDNSEMYDVQVEDKIFSKSLFNRIIWLFSKNRVSEIKN